MLQLHSPHLLCLYAALTCPSSRDWTDLMVEVLERSAGIVTRQHDPMWEALMDHLVANVAEA